MIDKTVLKRHNLKPCQRDMLLGCCIVPEHKDKETWLFECKNKVVTQIIKTRQPTSNDVEMILKAYEPYCANCPCDHN